MTAASLPSGVCFRILTMPSASAFPDDEYDFALVGRVQGIDAEDAAHALDFVADREGLLDQLGAESAFL